MKDVSLMRQFLGDTAYVRIIDFLVGSKGEEFTKKQIAEGAEVSRATVFNAWPAIEKNGIIRVTRAFGKTKLYTLNGRNPLVQKLLDLERALITQAMARHRTVLAEHR